MSQTVAKPGARMAYDVLAPFYDTFTAHHDYDLWTAVIRRLGAEHGLSGNRLLDIGCGTGKSFLPFATDGWHVTACDLSRPMLDRAASKAPDGVELHVADARALPVYGSFDMVLLLDDVINYMTEPADLADVFRGVRANLDADGVVVFDANQLLSYRTFFAETHAVEDDDAFIVFRGRSSADAEPGALTEMVIDAFHRQDGDRWERHVSVHHQRHYPEHEIRAALLGAGLECVGVYGHGLDGDPSPGIDPEGDTKALYIARHRASSREEVNRAQGQQDDRDDRADPLAAQGALTHCHPSEILRGKTAKTGWEGWSIARCGVLGGERR